MPSVLSGWAVARKTCWRCPSRVINTFGYALGLAQNGLSYPDSKTLRGFKLAVVEVLEDHDSDIFRAVYTARFDDVVYVLHCFKKKSKKQGELPKPDKATIELRLKETMAIEDAKRKKSKGN